MEYSEEQVESVLHSFYNSGYTVDANQWLMSAQISDSGWEFSWKFLQHDKPDYVQFFGACTLCTKIIHSGRALPLDKAVELRTSLLGKLLECSEYANHAVVSKLCIAVAHLAFYMSPDHWPGVVESIVDYIQAGSRGKSQEANVKAICALTELLRIIPEEFCAVLLPAQKRAAVKEDLEAGVPRIMAYFREILSTGHCPKQVYCSGINALSAWLQFSVPIDNSVDLVLIVFQALHDADLFEEAVECLCNIFSHPSVHKFPGTVSSLLPYIVSLDECLDKALTDGSDTAQGLCRLVTTVCESQCRLLLDTCYHGDTELTHKLLAMVLRCTDAPGRFPTDEQVSDSALYFWYLLQDELTSCDETKWSHLVGLFQDAYMRLVVVLLRKCQLPDEAAEAELGEDDREKFRCYREDIGDTFMYAYNILKANLFQWVYSLLYSFCTADYTPPWQHVESVLFLVQAIAENVVDNDTHDAELRDIFSLLPRLPLSSNVRCIQAALDMISAYQEWMSDNPYVLNNVLPTVLRCLQLGGELGASAGKALRNICQINQLQMLPHGSAILDCLSGVLSTQQLPPADANRLMCCVGYTVSMLPRDTMIAYLDKICTPQLLQLCEACGLDSSGAESADLQQQQRNSASQPALKALILTKLKLFGWLFTAMQKSNPAPPPVSPGSAARRNSDVPHLIDDDDDVNESSSDADLPQLAAPHVGVLWLLDKLLRPIERVTRVYVGDRELMEAVFDLFKWALRATQLEFEPLIGTLTSFVVQAYAEMPQSVLLDLAKQILICFHSSAPHSDTVSGLLTAMASRTLQHLREAEAQNCIGQSTDIIESFLSLMYHAIRRASGSMQLHQLVDMNSVFKVALCGLSLPELSTLKTACLLLVEFITHCDRYNGQSVLMDHMRALCHRIVRAIGGDSPRFAVDHLATVLLCLVRSFPAEARRCLSELLAGPDYPTPRVTEAEKSAFLNGIIRHRGSKKMVKQEILNFGLRCRGLYGTQYALETANSMAMMSGDAGGWPK
ncbi:hypothetical protein BOX15_Mlig020371g1 [Macrostomum lignano]|nr:hypothetical protein BOX15_Mlig020371g2 [Macrostomum lignano]PAA87219.1 hypothetical protein BOX15_Mlig020371g1 [Macrostomum lignano]